MAYNDAGDVIVKHTCPVFGGIGILGPIILTNASATFETLIDIPWKTCRLVSARFDCTTAVDTGSAGMNIDLELNAAGGTTMMNIAVAASAAVASQTYGTVSSAAACNNLDRDEATRDKINVEVDGTASAAGAGMLWMIFEPISGNV